MQECIRVRNATIRKAVQTEDRQVTKNIAISLAQEGESVERIARILGETEKKLKNGWLKRIKIGSAVSLTECY
jgi:predicted HTH domain antitoxin